MMSVKTNPAEKEWFVLYTRSRAEKKVRDELLLKNIECFLPLQKKLRQWKDRKKWVEAPLFSGYCFVHISRFEYDEVLKTNGAVCYIFFEGKAATLSEQQINALKQMLKQNDFEITVSHQNFKKGKKVEIIEGPMTGLQGELIEARGRKKFIMRLNQINNSITVEIPATYLTPVPKKS